MAAERRRSGDARPSAPPLAKRFYDLGGHVSQVVATVAGHPAAIVSTILVSALWLLLRGDRGETELSLALAIVAITLTQMVLNQQRRNDRALHLKLDELLIVNREARNEVVAIERQTEEEIEQLRRTDAELSGQATGTEPPGGGF